MKVSVIFLATFVALASAGPSLLGLGDDGGHGGHKSILGGVTGALDNLIHSLLKAVDQLLHKLLFENLLCDKLLGKLESLLVTLLKLVKGSLISLVSLLEQLLGKDKLDLLTTKLNGADPDKLANYPVTSKLVKIRCNKKGTILGNKDGKSSHSEVDRSRSVIGGSQTAAEVNEEASSNIKGVASANEQQSAEAGGNEADKVDDNRSDGGGSVGRKGDSWSKKKGRKWAKHRDNSEASDEDADASSEEVKVKGKKNVDNSKESGIGKKGSKGKGKRRSHRDGDEGNSEEDEERRKEGNTRSSENDSEEEGRPKGKKTSEWISKSKGGKKWSNSGKGNVHWRSSKVLSKNSVENVGKWVESQVSVPVIKKLGINKAGGRR
ncbi:hypothetical protein WN55_01055 [Dufourea novaeangliae]|uniref:Uncharacterized protein n=1 Tax=Dufourea novaeangliae TaxID=178035 RepID=A0A154PDY5_DUFNO|nr:hypothetical protein WN55_01055 [Dufourea novaeangliae]